MPPEDVPDLDDLDRELSSRILIIEQNEDGSLDCDTTGWPPWQLVGVAAWLDDLARSSLQDDGDDDED